MEERSTHAGNVITKQLQRVVSVNTSEQYMKEGSAHTPYRECDYHATQMSHLTQHQQNMKERSTHAG